jgi:hypothetical protein
VPWRVLGTESDMLWAWHLTAELARRLPWASAQRWRLLPIKSACRRSACCGVGAAVALKAAVGDTAATCTGSVPAAAESFAAALAA